MGKIIEFSQYATADRRKENLMGLNDTESQHDPGIRMDDLRNVTFFTEDHWRLRLEWRKGTLVGKLRQIKQLIDSLFGKEARGRLSSLQRYRDNLRWKGKL